MPTLYGITNCNTVVKARKWLESNSIDYTFHDYKKLGIDKEHLKKWCEKLGWDKVLNMQGMMWRKASDAEKAKVIDQESAIDFMIKTPNAIKRPIVELGDGGLLRGFEVKDWENVFLK